jgi:uncharacterized protein (TIGR00369 family)
MGSPPPLAEHARLLDEVIPFNRFLGIRVARMESGLVLLELPFRPEFIGDVLRPALHGGVISTLADTAGGFAVWTRIALSDRVSTIDLRVDYLAPAAAETLFAEATVVRVGNRVGVVDIRCFQPSAPERVVATGKGVYNIKRLDEG